MTSAGAANIAPQWFSKFTDFAYDTSRDYKNNFDRLAAHRKWGRKLKNRRWIECLIATFDDIFGGDADFNKLEKWQALCRDVAIANPPGSITGCKKALGSREVLVNIVNLIDHRLMGVPVIRFKDHRDFHDFTTNGCIFPLAKAKQEGFIKELLRKL